MAYTTEISLPDAPDLDLPTAPNVPDITLPAAPNIDIDIPAPPLDTITEPGPFNFTEDAYNSDIRVTLFNKILNDNANRNITLSQAQQALTANAIEIFNATVARQSLLLNQYKTEVQVFESKIRAELAAVEVYGGLNVY